MSVRDERFEALLGAAAPLIAAVFDALPDAIGVVWPTFDAARALVDFEAGYTNPSSERMMGVRLGDEIGARLRDAMPGVVTMGLFDRLLRVAETREAESAEITWDTMWRDAIHVSGVWVHTVLPFGSGLLSVAFDVSEERRRESELRDFAAVAAHDLREPLLGVHVMASLLGRRGGLGPEEQKMIRLLDDGVQRATGLVDNAACSRSRSSGVLRVERCSDLAPLRWLELAPPPSDRGLTVRAHRERGAGGTEEWDPEWSSSNRSGVTALVRGCRSGRLRSGMVFTGGRCGRRWRRRCRRRSARRWAGRHRSSARIGRSSTRGWWPTARRRASSAIPPSGSGGGSSTSTAPMLPR